MGIIGTNCFYPLRLRFSIIPLDLKGELCNLLYFRVRLVQCKSNSECKMNVGESEFP